MLLLPSSRSSLPSSCGSGLLFPIYPFSHSFPLLPGALIFSLLKSHFPQGSALSFPFSFYTIAGWSQPISCLWLPRLVGSAPALSLRSPQPRVSKEGWGHHPEWPCPLGHNWMTQQWAPTKARPISGLLRTTFLFTKTQEGSEAFCGSETHRGSSREMSLAVFPSSWRKLCPRRDTRAHGGERRERPGHIPSPGPSVPRAEQHPCLPHGLPSNYRWYPRILSKYAPFCLNVL